MHILTDCNVGGAGRWLLNYLKNYDKANFELEVVLPKGSLLTGYVRKTGVKVHELPYLHEKSFELKAVMPLFKFIKEAKPDIVHTHASLTARIAARLSGTKAIVATKHCLNSHTSSLAKLLNKIVNTLLADRIIAISEAVKSNLIESGVPDNKITVIYNGIEPLEPVSDTEKEAIRQNLGILPGELVVGIAARLEEAKGHKFFLEAAPMVRKHISNVKFVIAGTGSQMLNLKILAKEYKLEDCVIFTGYYEKIEKLFAIFDINVIVSVSEALCLSLIEGMSLGLPCIAFDTGGIKEVIDEDSGIIVPLKDTEKLSEAIIKLLNNEELRAKMGNKGKIIANTKFSAKRMVSEIENLYRELINNRMQ